MKKIKSFIFILFVSMLVGNCSTLKEGFINDKKKGTDEFLVEKKQPLTMPPNFEKLPLPNTTLDVETDKVVLGNGNFSKFGGIVSGCFFSTKNSSVPFFLSFTNPFCKVEQFPTKIETNKIKINDLIFFIILFIKNFY